MTLAACISHEQTTHGSSQQHRTSSVLLFPRPPHQQPALQTQWLLPCSLTPAVGQPGLLEAFQLKKLNKVLITSIINSFGPGLLPPCSLATPGQGLPHSASSPVAEGPQGSFSGGCTARSPWASWVRKGKDQILLSKVTEECLQKGLWDHCPKLGQAPRVHQLSVTPSCCIPPSSSPGDPKWVI